MQIIHNAFSSVSDSDSIGFVFIVAKYFLFSYENGVFCVCCCWACCIFFFSINFFDDVSTLKTFTVVLEEPETIMTLSATM